MRLQLSVRSQVAHSRYSSYAAQGDRVTSSSAPFRVLSCISRVSSSSCFHFFPPFFPLLSVFFVFGFFFFFCFVFCLVYCCLLESIIRGKKRASIYHKGVELSFYQGGGRLWARAGEEGLES